MSRFLPPAPPADVVLTAEDYARKAEVQLTADDYRRIGERKNTQKAYDSAIRHFQEEGKGYLPATPESVGRYLAKFAPTLSINTLQLRLAALAEWHRKQGFPDPTKTPHIKEIMRGIRQVHGKPEKRAKPLQFEQIAQVAQWLDTAIAAARTQGQRGEELRHLRDKALLLIGFWRGFRSDELAGLLVEHIEVVPGYKMTCYLPKTKGDRDNKGSSFVTDAVSLRWLCPVEAYLEWQYAAHLTRGPVFRAIDRWGHVGDTALHVDSVPPLLRSILAEAGIDDVGSFSSHSLRRGFATWAAAHGYQVQEIMSHVGWKDVKSALRYVERQRSSDKQLMERAIVASLHHEKK